LGAVTLLSVFKVASSILAFNDLVGLECTELNRIKKKVKSRSYTNARQKGTHSSWFFAIDQEELKSWTNAELET